MIFFGRIELRSAKGQIYAQSEELENAKRQKEALDEEIKRNKTEINSLRKANTKVNDDIKEIRQELGITQVKIASLGNIMELEQVMKLSSLLLCDQHYPLDNTSAIDGLPGLQEGDQAVARRPE